MIYHAKYSLLAFLAIALVQYGFVLPMWPGLVLYGAGIWIIMRAFYRIAHAEEKAEKEHRPWP